MAFLSLRLPAALLLMTSTCFVMASDIEIHGSNTVGASLAPALVKGYAEERGATSVLVRPGDKENEKQIIARLDDGPLQGYVAAHGSGTGFKGLNSGQAQIAAASRPAKDKEINLLAAKADLRDASSEHVIAIDGLAILVHPSNPVTTLDKERLAQIFAGEITNWASVGGPDRSIRVYARDNRSGTWDTFNNLVLGKKLPLAEGAKRYESNDQLSDDVSADPAGIGFTGLASVRNAKVLAISDGESAPLMPTRLNVATEDYPLSRRLFFYSLGDDAKPLTQEFLAFSQSIKGQDIVEDTGYVSQNIQAMADTLGDNVPDSLKQLTRNYDRLTVNFRFSEGRTKLDNKAHRDLERLQEFLQLNQATGADLMLIGFADKQSHELRAQMISELRALSVKSALRAHQGINVKAITGYGHYVPVGDSGGAEGASRNGRVEVWFRKPS